MRFEYTVARDGLVTDKEVLKEKLGHGNHCFQFMRLAMMCWADEAEVRIPVRDGDGGEEWDETFGSEGHGLLDDGDPVGAVEPRDHEGGVYDGRGPDWERRVVEAGFGSTHRCRDWKNIYKFVIDNTREWASVPYLSNEEAGVDGSGKMLKP